MKALYVLVCVIVIFVTVNVIPSSLMIVASILLVVFALFGFFKVMCNEAYEPKYENFRRKTTGRLGRWFENLGPVADLTSLETLKELELRHCVIPTFEELRNALTTKELQDEFQRLGEEIHLMSRERSRSSVLEDNTLTRKQRALLNRYYTLRKIASEVTTPRQVRDYSDLTVEEWRRVKKHREFRRASAQDDFAEMQGHSRRM